MDPCTIDLCEPELSEDELDALYLDHLENDVETAAPLAWDATFCYCESDKMCPNCEAEMIAARHGLRRAA